MLQDIEVLLKYSYNYHVDDCDEIMTLGLADVSHMSIFKDFEETDRDEFHGRIIDQFAMILPQLITREVLSVLVLMIWGMIPGLIQPCTLAK